MAAFAAFESSLISCDSHWRIAAIGSIKIEKVPEESRNTSARCSFAGPSLNFQGSTWCFLDGGCLTGDRRSWLTNECHGTIWPDPKCICGDTHWHVSGVCTNLYTSFAGHSPQSFECVTSNFFSAMDLFQSSTDGPDTRTFQPQHGFWATYSGLHPKIVSVEDTHKKWFNTSGWCVINGQNPAPVDKVVSWFTGSLIAEFSLSTVVQAHGLCRYVQISIESGDTTVSSFSLRPVAADRGNSSNMTLLWLWFDDGLLWSIHQYAHWWVQTQRKMTCGKALGRSYNMTCKGITWRRLNSVDVRAVSCEPLHYLYSGHWYASVSRGLGIFWEGHKVIALRSWSAITWTRIQWILLCSSRHGRLKMTPCSISSGRSVYIREHCHTSHH